MYLLVYFMLIYFPVLAHTYGSYPVERNYRYDENLNSAPHAENTHHKPKDHTDAEKKYFPPRNIRYYNTKDKWESKSSYSSQKKYGSQNENFNHISQNVNHILDNTYGERHNADLNENYINGDIKVVPAHKRLYLNVVPGHHGHRLKISEVNVGHKIKISAGGKPTELESVQYKQGHASHPSYISSHTAGGTPVYKVPKPVPIPDYYTTPRYGHYPTIRPIKEVNIKDIEGKEAEHIDLDREDEIVPNSPPNTSDEDEIVPNSPPNMPNEDEIVPNSPPNTPNEDEIVSKSPSNTPSDLFEGSGDIDSRSLEDKIKDVNSSDSTRFMDFFVNSNATCTTPKNEPGHCVNFRECVLHDIVSNFNMYLQYMCMTRNTFIGICCPDNPVIDVANPEEENATEALGKDSKIQPPNGCGINPRTRIVGGTTAEPHEWTWMVALLRQGRFFCGGVLINNWYALTAAHCVMGMDIRELSIRLGEHNFHEKLQHQRDIPLSQVKRHAKFTSMTFQNDIALIKLRRPVEFTRFIGTICLPHSESNYTGVNATVAGWGTMSFGGSASPILRQVTIPVWDNRECDNTYLLEDINESFMCAGSPNQEQDACQGDSGGPLMALNEGGRWEVIGLVSWGRRCGDPNFPGVYTRVTTYLDWIRENAT